MGPGIFDDDIAQDVRTTFEEALTAGASMPEVTKQVQSEYEDIILDPDEGPVVFLALAALQIEHGTIDPGLRDWALEIIEKRYGLAPWEEAGTDALAEREQVLMALKEQLNAAPVVKER